MFFSMLKCLPNLIVNMCYFHVVMYAEPQYDFVLLPCCNVCRA